MIFKSFSQLYRHTAFAKTVFATSGNTPQPAFFATTNQLARQQSQLVSRPSPSAFGQAERNSSANPNGYTSICNSSSFSTLTPFSCLDDEKRRELLLSEASGSQSSYHINNHQYSLIRRAKSDSIRRFSSTKEDHDRPNHSGLNESAHANVFEEDTLPTAKNSTVSAANPSSVTAQNQPSLTAQEPLIPTIDDNFQSKNIHTPPSSPVNGPINPVEDLESQIESLSLAFSRLSDNSITATTENISVLPEEHDQRSEPSLTRSASSAINSPLTPPSSIEVENFSAENTSKPAESSLDPDLSSSSSKTTLPTVELYNKQLKAATLLQDSDHEQKLSNILSIYSDMLAHRVSPNTSTYTILISSLIDAADSLDHINHQSLHFRGVQSRHKGNVLTSVKTEIEKLENSTSYATLAFDIFKASNAVKLQKYNPETYKKLLAACVTHKRTDMMAPILACFDSWHYKLDPISYVMLIEGYGATQDLAGSLEAFEHFKSSVLNNPAYESQELDVYASLVKAYFSSSNPAGAVEFVDKILSSSQSNNQNDHKTNIQKVLSAVIIGFSSIGDTKSAWTWVRKIEQDKSFLAPDLASLQHLFTAVCSTGDVVLANDIFDYMASRSDSASNVDFNQTRCDFLALCTQQNKLDLLYKAIKESHLRQGVWDACTLVDVVRYLIACGDTGFAVELFTSQSARLAAYESSEGDVYKVPGVGVEMINDISQELESRNLLTIRHALLLCSSAYFDHTVFSDPSGGGLRVLRAIWAARQSNAPEYLGWIASSPMILMDIISVHNMWLKSCSQSNFLGEVSIPTPILNEIRENYKLFVYDLINNNKECSSLFTSQVTSSLQVLNDIDTLNDWTKFLNPHKAHQPVIYPSNEIAKLSWDEVTYSILGLARSIDSLEDAFNLLSEAVLNRKQVGPEAYISILETALENPFPGSNHIVEETYTKALKNLTSPLENSSMWSSWVGIHRCIVQNATSNFRLAMNAYQHLLAMGSCPDATGYGQLIANAPSSGSHDDASDAITLFNEARSKNVVPNTFLYNVLLSKLSKARRLREAIAFYSDMEFTQTKKSSVTYGTMISACCRGGDEESAKKLFDEMEQSRSYTPKVAPFNTMLQFYVHTKGDRKSAKDVYNKMRALGIKPSPHTYKLLIDMYSSIEPVDIEMADNVLLTIVDDKGMITSKHYAALIFARGVCKRDIEATQQFYDSLVYRQRVKPDKNIFQALLESFVVNNQVRDTGKILQEMVKYGVDLDAYMANVLIRGWAPVNLEKSRGLFDHILKCGIAEPSSYESLIRAYLYHEDVASAQVVLHLMQSHRYPEPVVFKVQNLIDMFIKSKLKADGLLFESIFRQDAHKLGDMRLGSDMTSHGIAYGNNGISVEAAPLQQL